MTRKLGDRSYKNYVGYQNFSSDMPVHQINDSNWYLKFEHNIPGFFLNAENLYKQMPPKCFFDTAERSRTFNMKGYQTQCEQYFNLTMEKIKCLTEAQPKVN